MIVLLPKTRTFVLSCQRRILIYGRPFTVYLPGVRQASPDLHRRKETISCLTYLSDTKFRTMQSGSLGLMHMVPPARPMVAEGDSFSATPVTPMNWSFFSSGMI